MGASVIEIKDGVNGYVDLVKHVLNNGVEVAPRGLKTLEIEDAVIHIDNVYDTLPVGVGRGTVPGIGAVEACQLLSGTSYPNLVMAVGPQFANYAEDNGLFHGAYGLRTAGQYELIIQRLKADPDTRQAVVTIWNPQFDLQPGKKDYPCTVLHQFRIRNGKLNMSVYMRSNDVWLGAAYDFFQFTRVQLAIASILGIEPGTYSHHVGSLHIYEQHYESADKLKYAGEIEPIPYFIGRSWREVQASAQLALDAVVDLKSAERLTGDEQWYTKAMLSSIENHRAKAAARAQKADAGIALEPSEVATVEQ